MSAPPPLPDDLFVLPVLDRFLLYAPLRELALLVNRAALAELRQACQSSIAPTHPQLNQIHQCLAQPAPPPPRPRHGALTDPLFLGLIPTRGCNLACAYCDFIPAEDHPPTMPLELAYQAIDAYLDLLHSQGKLRGEIHFFGGEPFYAPELLRAAVNYARLRAERLGLELHFEATSNGVMSARLATWVGDYFDTLVLSLDGPQPLHDRQRPAPNGRGSFETVARTAQILSDSSCELHLRACITADSLPELPAIASWMAENFQPTIICFESLTPSTRSRQNGLQPPDPWQLARQFFAAARLLEPYGIQALLSTALTQSCQLSFCPVGKDALIVSPHGQVHACYLLEQDWLARGLDMQLGRLRPGRNGHRPAFEIEPAALARLRNLQVDNKPLCRDCFCRYHCAGGCHVNHPAQAAPGQYDALCLQTRLITLSNLLRALGQAELAQDWLADRAALERLAWQKSDRWL